jgi:tetratricopeptide (TPR) repeat protein
VNNIGNCQASLGSWEEARASYVFAGRLYQASNGVLNDRDTTTVRADGASFAQANAALALTQLKNLSEARRELEDMARRAPGSVDQRVALAGLYYHDGRTQAAKEMWAYACEQSKAGCEKYRDREWLDSVRRWPPAVSEMLEDFLELRERGGGEEAALTPLQDAVQQ